MNLSREQTEMHEERSLSLWPVQGIDTVLTDRFDRANSTLSILYCDLYLRQFKGMLKQTMLEQESVFEDQIHELHRLYRRQKELMMEMEGANSVCGQTQRLFVKTGVSSPRTSLHWMSASVSVSEVSVVPPEDASGGIDEARFSGDESDKSGDKVLDLEVPSYGYHDILEKEDEEDGSKSQKAHEVTRSFVQPENVQHLTGLLRLKGTLDLNEPAMVEEHSDYELNQFLNPGAEPEAEVALLSTRSENGIDLNMSPLSSEEKESIFKKKESVPPRESVSVLLQGKQGSGPSRRVIVQALPCSETISFFEQRCKSFKRNSRNRKETNQGAKCTKAREGLNLDLNVGVHEDDCLGSLPEVKTVGSMTSPGKTRRCKPRIEPDKAKKKVARTRSKTRVRFRDTEKEELEKSEAAEVIVAISLSDSARKTNIKTSNSFTPLHWFAKIASSVVKDSKSDVGLSGVHSDYALDYFQALVLQLTKVQRKSTSISNFVTPKQKRTPRSQGKRKQQQHKDCHSERLPSLSISTEIKASQYLDKIEKLNEASETNDARSSYNSLMENMSIGWGTITKRRRGIRSPATGFLKVPFSDS